MKYRALTTFQHNGGLYEAGADVPVDGRWADLLVKMGRVEAVEAKQIKAAPQANAKPAKGYNRRDMAKKTESK